MCVDVSDRIAKRARPRVGDTVHGIARQCRACRQRGRVIGLAGPRAVVFNDLIVSVGRDGDHEFADARRALGQRKRVGLRKRPARVDRQDTGQGRVIGDIGVEQRRAGRGVDDGQAIDELALSTAALPVLASFHVTLTVSPERIVVGETARPCTWRSG